MNLKHQTYLFILEDEFQGTPCKIGVISVLIVPPWRGNPYECPSDLDYYGYSVVEYDILKMDEKTSFEWLENKLTDQDQSDIEVRILEEYNDSILEDVYYD